MRTYKIIFFTLILLLLPLYSYSSTLGSLRTSLIQGDVQIKTGDSSEWVPAAINTPLINGDRVWVPKTSRAELQLRNGTYIRLDENSSLEILTIEEDSLQFYLTTGHAYVNFSGLKNGPLQIDTPISSIRAYDRSKFRIDVSDERHTEISVINGAVYAESRSGTTRVGAGKSLSLIEDTYAELSQLGPPDEWEKWNRYRDSKLLETRYSNRYLPEELEAYSYDFDENGKWVYTADYGYVWTPTVTLSAGWAPYRLGRWVWIGGDYVWVSYEPWGWVPYHYGRWSFVVSIGWVWVPPIRGAVYWGPGFVGWVYTPTFVAWVPLAPREIYYSYGYYGPGSVNIINIDIHKTVIKNVYKNVYINNAVTVVHRDTFIKGKHVDVKIKENLFLTKRLNIGSPAIKPEKTAFMPIIKEIPRVKQPPQSIRDIQVSELKKERPLVKEKKVSVTRPASLEKTMPVKESKVLDTRKSKERETNPQTKMQYYAKQQNSLSEAIERQKPQEQYKYQPKKSNKEDKDRSITEKNSNLKLSAKGNISEKTQRKIRDTFETRQQVKANDSKSSNSTSQRSTKKQPLKEDVSRGDRLEKAGRVNNASSFR